MYEVMQGVKIECSFSASPNTATYYWTLVAAKRSEKKETVPHKAKIMIQSEFATPITKSE